MITDKSYNKFIGITLWDSQTLQSILEDSGELAKDNEYMFHYYATIARQVFPDGSIIDIAIPTVIFNYPQEVTGAHVDFELKDVITASDIMKELSIAEENIVTPILRKMYPKAKIITSAYNTCHKHPGGRSQSFSSQDLRKDHKDNTGIVFPLKSVSIPNQPCCSSILCTVDEVSYLAHTEYRFANGDTDKELQYLKGRSAAIVKQTSSLAEKELGIHLEDTYKILNNIPASQFINDVARHWLTTDYKPSVIIDSNNLTRPKRTQSLFPNDYYPTIDYSTTPYKKETKRSSSIEQEAKVSLLEDDIHIIPEGVLRQLSTRELAKQLSILEKYYYNSTGEVTEEHIKDNMDISPKELIESVSEYQDLVLRETYAFLALEKDELYDELQLYGIITKPIEEYTYKGLSEIKERLTKQ